MNAKIYKYFSGDVIDLVFEKADFCAVKCSYPKEYNDPYELFLGVDLDVPADHLATYRDIVHDLPQFPTTCFSKSPIVSPMWAHYANNHSGFVLEFDVEKLEKYFNDIRLSDVIYKNAPDSGLSEILARAVIIKKPRYAVWLQQTAFSEAYFSKYTDWSYEQECRLVVENKTTQNINGNQILFIPIECITAIIIGNQFPEKKIKVSCEIADTNSLDWYKLVIGKSFPVPYLVNQKNCSFIFDGNLISLGTKVCGSCSEPLNEDRLQCPWCSITEAQKFEAAAGNPFRIIDHYGGLEEYFEGINEIERKRRK